MNIKDSIQRLWAWLDQEPGTEWGEHENDISAVLLALDEAEDRYQARQEELLAYNNQQVDLRRAAEKDAAIARDRMLKAVWVVVGPTIKAAVKKQSDGSEPVLTCQQALDAADAAGFGNLKITPTEMVDLLDQHLSRNDKSEVW